MTVSRMRQAQLFRRAVGQDAALVHHQDAVAQGRGLLHVVRAEQHRHLALRAQHLEQGLDLLLGSRVETRGRLVHQQQRWRGEEAACDRDLLLLPARELPHGLVDHIEGQPEPAQDVHHLLACAVRPAAVQARGVQHVLPGAQLFEERGLDGDAVDVPAHREGLGDDVPTEDGRAPGVRGQQGAEDADQGRLAAAVGPEDAGHAAGLDHQVELVEGDLVFALAPPPGRALLALGAPERFGDSLQLDRCDCAHRLTHSSSHRWKKQKTALAQLPHGPDR